MNAEHEKRNGEPRQRIEIKPDVITRAARGDVGAFNELYAQIAPGLRRYVRTMVWNPWDAEDITQEVFVKILLGLEQYDSQRAAFPSWALRVAHNATVDHMRRRRPQPVQDVVDDHAVEDDAGARCAESLREALASLTVLQREILMLRALGGYTPPEIASHVHRSRGSINTVYHRARIAAKDNLTAMGAAPSTSPRVKRVAEERTPVLAA